MESERSSPREARVLVVSGFRAADGPYGIDKLADFGYELVEVDAARSRFHRKVRDVIEHRTGVPSDHAVRSILRASSADIVFCFLEGHAVLPSLWSALRLPPYARRPLAMLACWLAEDLRRMPALERRALVRRYRGVDLTFVFSANQVDVLTDAGFAADSVESISFGFSPEQHLPVPQAQRTGGIVAVGFDRGRDYATLADAVRGTDIEVDVYCKEGNLEGIVLPPTMRARGVVDYDEYRRVIANARVVAVPTRAMTYPSGQTVALEAGATGACLAITDTPALRDYFSERTALMVPSGDVEAWREALQSAVDDAGLVERLGEAARSDIRRRFTYRQMWGQVDAQFRRRGWAP